MNRYIAVGLSLFLIVGVIGGGAGFLVALFSLCGIYGFIYLVYKNFHHFSVKLQDIILVIVVAIMILSVIFSIVSEIKNF